MEQYRLILFIIQIIVIGITALVILVFVILPMIKAFSQKSDDISLHRYQTTHSNHLSSLETESTTIKLSGLASGERNQIVVDKALEDREKTTLLIRNWLHEKK